MSAALLDAAVYQWQPPTDKITADPTMLKPVHLQAAVGWLMMNPTFKDMPFAVTIQS